MSPSQQYVSPSQHDVSTSQQYVSPSQHDVSPSQKYVPPSEQYVSPSQLHMKILQTPIDSPWKPHIYDVTTGIDTRTKPIWSACHIGSLRVSVCWYLPTTSGNPAVVSTTHIRLSGSCPHQSTITATFPHLLCWRWNQPASVPPSWSHLKSIAGIGVTGTGGWCSVRGRGNRFEQGGWKMSRFKFMRKNAEWPRL